MKNIQAEYENLCDDPLSAPRLRLARRNFASLQKPLQNHRSCVLIRALSGMLFAPAQELSMQYSVVSMQYGVVLT